MFTFSASHDNGNALIKSLRNCFNSEEFAAQRMKRKMSSLETFGDDVKMSSNRRKISNPSPLGLSAFAMNTFVYSVYIYGVRGIDRDNVGVGLALFYGGVIQVLAAMWEMYYGNTFPATVFASYGEFV